MGPLLFNIFINDITSVVNESEIILYADDIKLYKSISTIDDTTMLQADLNALVSWSASNHLPFNIKKCPHITFTRKMTNICHSYAMMHHSLTTVDSVRDLGLTLDKRLYFDLHIENVIRRCRKGLGFILRNTTAFTNVTTYLILYFAYIRSVMEFGIVIWAPVYKKHSDALEAIQRRFLKLAYSRVFQYYPIDLPYQDILDGFRVDSLAIRRQVIVLMHLHSIIHGSDQRMLQEIGLRVPRSNARIHDTFYLNQSLHRGALRYSFLGRTCSLYNSMMLQDTARDVLDILAQNRGEFLRGLWGVLRA